MNRGNHFLIRRVHSLLGIIPLGIFLIFHFYVNSLALNGSAFYDKFVNTMMGMLNLPYFVFVELFVIFIPLLLHGIYGLYIVYNAKMNVGSYGYGRNWAFALQRISGIIMFIFLVWHVWALRLANVFYGAPVNFDAVAQNVSTPISLAFFILGIVATAYHFANGLWGFLVTWGVTIGRSSQKKVALASIAIFIAFAFVGVRAILAFV